VVAVPAAAVPQTLEDAIAAGVKGLVLFSSGFAEVDVAGREAQQRLAGRAREAGVRLFGPNCLGLMAFASNVYATFSPAPRAGETRVGNIAIVSQSGAFGAFAYSLARIKGLGMSYWMTTGNEADIEFADCVEWLAHDPSTKVILGYMEGCRDGAKLKRALAAAQAAGKSVAITKVGRTALGSAAAASHTAALTGQDAVYEHGIVLGAVRVGGVLEDRLLRRGGLADGSGLDELRRSGDGRLGHTVGCGGLDG
jgi:acyl-CoA synthetase (NDP forming)